MLCEVLNPQNVRNLIESLILPASTATHMNDLMHGPVHPYIYQHAFTLICIV